MRQTQAKGKTFPTDTAVDFVLIGSGIAGGSVARELTSRGFDVVVLEQGREVPPEDMEHDELGGFMQNRRTRLVFMDVFEGVGFFLHRIRRDCRLPIGGGCR